MKQAPCTAFMCFVVIRENMEKIKIGKIVNAVGLKGEVKVYNYSDRRERYEELERVICGKKEYTIENVRYQNHMVILKLEGVNDRNASEAMKNTDVFITEEDLCELPDDTFYVRDLIGLDVKDFDADKVIGKVKDIIQNTAQDVYSIKLENGGETMVPSVKEFIKEINMEEGFVCIKFIEGMIE